MKFFHHYEVPIKYKNSPLSNVFCHNFSAQDPERYRQSSCCGPFEVEQPERYQNLFFNPKRYDEHPRPFCMGVPPPGGLEVAYILAGSTLQIIKSSSSHSNDHAHQQCFQLDLQYGGGATNPAGLSPGILLQKYKSNPIPPSRAYNWRPKLINRVPSRVCPRGHPSGMAADKCIISQLFVRGTQQHVSNL